MSIRGNRQILGAVKGQLSRSVGFAKDLHGRKSRAGLSPYELAEKYASGEVPRSELVKQLSAWPFKPSQNRTNGPHDDLLVSVPGSFDDVDRALRNGLIDDEAYDEIADAHEAALLCASRAESVLGPITDAVRSGRKGHEDSPVVVVFYSSRTDTELKATVRALQSKHIRYTKVNFIKNSELEQGLSKLGFSRCPVVVKDGTGRTWAGPELEIFNALPFSSSMQQGR